MTNILQFKLQPTVVHCILIASCDANYFFTVVDIGAYGSLHDSRVFQDSVFGKTLKTNGLKHISSEKNIEGCCGVVPQEKNC
jgi:hypothetical protein